MCMSVHIQRSEVDTGSPEAGYTRICGMSGLLPSAGISSGRHECPASVIN